jgi:tetratricopeptide (TPR) repeat protein
VVVGDAGAVEELKALVRESPSEGRYWNDLAVASLELSTMKSDSEILALALAASDRSLECNAAMPEALFNRGVILQALGVPHAASDAFRRYLQVDGTSEWAAEVRDRLRMTEMRSAAELWNEERPLLEAAAESGDRSTVERIVERHRQSSRTWAEGEYLGRWGEEFSAGRRSEADRWLRVGRMIGSILRQSSGESLLADSVDRIDVAVQSKGASVNMLADAYSSYRAGRILYHKRDIARAVPLLERAVRRFATAGTPMELMAKYYLANAFFDQHRDDDCLRVLAHIDSRTPRSYGALRAQTSWTRSSALAQKGLLFEALDARLLALRWFAAAGERENTARLRIDTAALLTLLGRRRDAWNMRREAFVDAAHAGNANLVERALNGAAHAAIRERRWDVARSFLQVEIGLPAPSARLHADALIWRGLVEQERPSGVDVFGRARIVIRRISDGVLRRDAEDDLAVAEAHVLSASTPHRSVELLKGVIERRRTSNIAGLSAALLERARARRKLGDRQGAIEDLKEAVANFDRLAFTIARDELRDAFFGTADEVVDELLALLVESGDLENAFSVAEHARGNGRPLSATAVSLAKIRRRLPESAVMAHFTTMRDRTLLWVVTRHASRALLLPSGRATMIAMIKKNNGRQLFDALLQPLRAELSSATRLLIVADPLLASIPFSTLVEPDTGRYLIESFPINVSLNCSGYFRPRTKRTTAVRAVIVGDPAIDLEHNPTLERLPGALNEAKAVSALYTGATLLTGETATIRQLSNAASAATILHVAAHGIINERDPWLSALVLAPDRDSSGLLYLHQIPSLPLGHIDVVVLAGCRTAASVDGPGVMRSLAAAFLASGCRNVVAALRDVSDDTTRSFSTALHRHIAAGIDPVEALQRTQLAMLRAADPSLRDPATWGAFQIFSSAD